MQRAAFISAGHAKLGTDADNNNANVSASKNKKNAPPESQEIKGPSARKTN
jgi:hypothetical protein